MLVLGRHDSKQIDDEDILVLDIACRRHDHKDRWTECNTRLPMGSQETDGQVSYVEMELGGSDLRPDMSGRRDRERDDLDCIFCYIMPYVMLSKL